ncbi:MAG: oligosaccharide flippase family protein [Syntrophobacteraceae bacterium]
MSSDLGHSESSLDKYWRGLFWSISSFAIRFTIGIGSSILFVRYLGDTGYGAVVVMADFVTLSIVLLSQGLGVVQTRVVPQLFVQNELGMVKDFLYKVFMIRIALSLIASLLLYPFIPWLHAKLFPEVNSSLLVVALVLIPVQMTWTCFRGTLEVTYHQKELVFTDVAGLIFRLLAAAPVIYFDLGVVWFFGTQVFTDLFLTLLYGYLFRVKVWARIADAARIKFKGKMWSVGWIMMLVLFSGKLLGKEMDTQILSYRLKAAALPEIAIYTISFYFVVRCLALIGSADGGIANLTQSIMSELVHIEDFKGLRTLYSSQLQIYYFFAIPLALGGWVLSERILTLMYGASFAGGGNVCGLLFMVFGWTIISKLNYPMIYSLGREKSLLVERTLWGYLNVVGSYYLAPWGAIGVASATGLCMVGMCVCETLWVRRLISPSYPIRFMLKILGGALLMAVLVALFIKDAPFNSQLLNLLGAVVIGTIVFGASQVALKPICKSDVESSRLFSGPIRKALYVLAR